MVARKPVHRCRIFDEVRYALAADIGQSADPTAIAIIEHVHSSELHINGKELDAWDQYRVRHLQRLPLGTNYVEQMHAVLGLLERPPLDRGCDFIIDDTGVGRGVGDLWSRERTPIRVTITGGDKQTARGPMRWMVPKSLLISTLDAKLHSQELKIAPDLAEAPVLLEELRDFRRHISAAGRYSFDARTGRHDDLVLAVALALWNFTSRPKPILTKVTRYAIGKPVRT